MRRVVYSILVMLCLAFPAFGQSPYVLPPASHEHVQTISGSGSTYQIDMGGTLDEFNTASYPDTYNGQKRLLSWFQPNEYLMLENTGDVNVVNPRIVVNGRRNWHSADELLASIITPGMTDAEKAMAIWSHTASIEVQCHDNNRLVGFLPRPPEEGTFPERGNPIKGANSYYCGGCSLTSANFAVLCRAAGLDSRTVWMCPHDTYEIHCVAEAWYDGGWHLFDPDRRSFYLESDNTTVASYETLHNNPYLATRTWDSGFPGDGMSSHDIHYQRYYPPREMPIDTWLSTMDMTLRPGEKFLWRWDHIEKYRCGNNPRNIKPERPEGLLPYQLANGKMIYSPNFREDIFQRDIVAAENLESVTVAGGQHQLQPMEAGDPSSVIYRVQSPYPIVGGVVGGKFLRQTSGDVFRMSLSKDNNEWTEIWDATGVGTIEEYIAIDDVLNPKPTEAIYEYYLKYELQAAAAPSNVVCLEAYLETDVQMAATSLASLSVGANNVVYSDASEPGRQVRLSHGWKESSATRPPLPPAHAITPGSGQQVGLQVLDKLCWEPASDPDGEGIADYHVQVSPREDFLHPVSPNLDRLTHSGSPEWDLPQGWLNSGQDYYWRVRAKDAAGAWSGWSEAFHFTTFGEIEPPELILTGHWTFDNDGADSIGGHDATLLNGASIETPSVGHAFAGSNALRLDGNDDIATISIDALPPGPFTIAFWEYTLDTDQAYFVATDDPSSELFLQRRDGVEEVRGRIQGQLFPAMDLSMGEWHHHVITNEETGGIWYIDGEERGQMEMPSLWVGGKDPLVLGNRLSDYLRGLNGYLDDLQIYVGAADAEEVAWLFAHPGQAIIEETLDGDLNGDGFVGGDDLDIVRSFWGQSVEQGCLLQGDPSGDGFVGGDDLDVIRANWGQILQTIPDAVPEPTQAVLWLIGFFTLFHRKR